MLPVDYLIAVHKALKERIEFRSQDHFDGAVEVFGKGREDSIHRDISTRESFIPRSYIKPHIIGATVIDYEDRNVSLFRFFSFGVLKPKVRADYKTAKLEFVKDLEDNKGKLIKNKETIIRGIKLDLESFSIKKGNSKGLKDLLSNFFKPGENYIRSEYEENPFIFFEPSADWYFFDPIKKKHISVDHTFKIVAVAGERNNGLYNCGLDFEEFPSNGSCLYDGKSIKFIGYPRAMMGDFSERGYVCKNCNTHYSKPTTKREQEKLKREREERLSKIVFCSKIAA